MQIFPFSLRVHRHSNRPHHMRVTESIHYCYVYAYIFRYVNTRAHAHASGYSQLEKIHIHAVTVYKHTQYLHSYKINAL